MCADTHFKSDIHQVGGGGYPRCQLLVGCVCLAGAVVVCMQVATEFLEGFAKAYKAEHSSSSSSNGGGVLQVAPVRLLTPVTGHVRLIWPPKA